MVHLLYMNKRPEIGDLVCQCFKLCFVHLKSTKLSNCLKLLVINWTFYICNVFSTVRSVDMYECCSYKSIACFIMLESWSQSKGLTILQSLNLPPSYSSLTLFNKLTFVKLKQGVHMYIT